jgi:SSS family solute:Na+ symporter
MHLALIDWAVLAVYFAFVLGIGWLLKRSAQTGNDFFMAGRAIPSWVAGLAFLSANLGAQEVIGMAASGAKYGMATSHFYWIGAIPAMVFVGVFMMPFYYGSRARSVPEYLKLRFDSKTHVFNAVSFAVMTIFSSGISLYAMAKLLMALHICDAPMDALGLPRAWLFHVSVFISAFVVLSYVFFGGLTSAIYNEVLQFFLILAGLIPLVWLGLKDLGGWHALKAALPNPAMAHAWVGLAHARTNPMGVNWFSLTAGLGFVLSFGYWCTDFLVIQRAMAADSMTASRRTPLIAAVPKMLFPFIVILPGLIAVALAPKIAASLNSSIIQSSSHQEEGLIPIKRDEATGEIVRDSSGQAELDYNMVIPALFRHYYPAGLLGLGLTALLASFMSGMAGNVTAFNTIWTYDLYQAYIKPGAPDRHYLWMGRAATVGGVGLSILAAYLAARFNNIMDVLQLVFAFVNAPLFATFLLGMFWKKTTGHGAFLGLLSGTLAATIHQGLTLPQGSLPGLSGGWIMSLQTYPSLMAQNFWTAIYAWGVCFFVTIAVSLLTAPKAEGELAGLVYSLTDSLHEDRGPFFKRPAVLGIMVLILVAILNFVFR